MKKDSKVFRTFIIILFCLILVGCDPFKTKNEPSHKILVGNVAENRKIYNNLKSEISIFSSYIGNSKYLTFTIETNTNGEKTSQTIKAINDEIYMEVFDNLSTKRKIIQEENDSIFQYTFNDIKNVNRKYLQKKDNFIPSNDLNIDTESLFSFTFNPEKGNAKYNDNTYTFKAYYKDSLDENSKQIIEEVYNSLGVSFTKLNDSIILINYTIKEDSMVISINLDLDLEVNNKPVKLNLALSYNISIQEFTKFDFTKYVFSIPTCFEEVMETTDLSKPYHLPQFYNAYLKVELEKGQYYINDDDNYYSYLWIEIYDLELNKVGAGINISSSYITKLNFTFVIPETKEYYINLRNGVSGDRNLTFTKLDYDTTFDINKPQKFVDTNGRIEGDWDLDYFEYNATETQILKITNNGENVLNLICNRYGGEYSDIPIKVNGHIYVKVSKGINKYYISNNLQFNTGAYDYSFKVEIIENNNGIESEYEKMDILKEDYSEKYYMAGYGIDDKYLKLNVNTKGLYSFQYECLDKSMMMQISILNKSGGYISSNYEIVLEPGEYIVKVTNNSHIFGIGRIKYTYFDIEDKDVEVVLSKSDIANLYNLSFTDLKSQKVIDSQVIKYYFTLFEDSSVLYDEDYMFIYDDKGRQISISPSYYIFQDYGIIELKAGRYYFTTPNMYGGLNQPLKIAIVEQITDTKQDLSNMMELNVGETKKFNKDWLCDKEYFQINIKENGTYLLSKGIYYIFDETLREVNTSYKESGIQFDAIVGTYYVIYVYDSNVNNSSISLTKVN